MSEIQRGDFWESHTKVEVQDYIEGRLDSTNEHFYFVEGTSSQAGNATSGSYLSTKWEASVPGVTAATNGLKLAYRINTNTGVSTAGVVLSVDGTNYYPVVLNKNSIVTTHYPVGSTILVVFNSTQTAQAYLTSNTKTTVTGCWQIMEYDSNTNTIGYQLRTHYSTLPVTGQTGRYRLLFSNIDNTAWVPANTSNTTNSTSQRNVNQTPINPFGEIVYYGYTTIIAANSNPDATYLWQQYPLTLGYSFNRTGSALVLTYPAPIYIKCTPQSDGSAIMDEDNPYVQQLPDTEDGKIYIYLGRVYNATDIELVNNHPVYCYKDGAIRLYTNTSSASTPHINSLVYVDATTVQAGNNSTSAGVKLSTLFTVELPEDITTPYNGLHFLVKIHSVGVSNGTGLSIDGGSTYIPILQRYGSSLTNPGVPSETILLLVYNSTITSNLTLYLTQGTATTYAQAWEAINLSCR